MQNPENGEVLRHFRAIFDAESVSGLADAQLLERFNAGRGEGAEVAFEALVTRHGPMVLRSCRSALLDEHEAQDAFQATFLVLARRARSLWVRDSLGPWLHKVSMRVAACARSAASRRRAIERRAAEMAATRPIDGGEGCDDLAPVLHEEVDRLPDRFRAAVVLCDLQGLTHQEAAQQLRWPIGTVKSRQARGRERLRARLLRRGLAPSAGAITSALAADEALAAVPASLARMTARVATRVAAGRATAGAASVVALSGEVLRSMAMSKLKLGLVFALAAGCAATGVTVVAQIANLPGQGEPARLNPPVQGEDPPASALKAVPGRERSILDRLEQPVDLGLARPAPLGEVIKVLKAASVGPGDAGIPIEINPQGLAEVQKNLESSVLYPKGKVPLGVALGTALRPLGLSFAVRDGVLIIDSRDTLMESRLGDLERKLDRALELLAERRGNSNGSQTAGIPAGGGGGLIGGGGGSRAVKPPVRKTPQEEARDQAIREKLEQPISLPFEVETPLEDIIKYIKQATAGPDDNGISIYLDPVGLKEADATTSSPIKINIEGVPLKTGLRLMLRQLGLGYAVKDGLLIISEVDSSLLNAN